MDRTVPLCTPPTSTSAPACRPATLAKLVFKVVRGSEQIFLAPDDEDADRQDGQRSENKERRGARFLT
jgi:hypothetical protein